MSPKVKIKITGEFDGEYCDYTFHVHMEKRRIELILKRPFNSTIEMIIGMNLVPDLAQIQFYKELNKRANEYQTANLNK